MEKRVWLVAAGTMFIVGCQSETVMDQRRFAPVAENDPASVVSVEKPAATSGDNQKFQAAEPAQTETSYAPMSGVKSSGGISGTAATSGGKGGVYVVKSGDTLGKIAKQNGVKLADLMAANNLSEKDAKKLYVGKKLTIPAGGKVVAGAKAQAKSEKATAETPAAALDKDGFYVVKSGDTPEKIARRNKIKLADLMKANNLTPEAARRLQIGDKLVIPGKSSAEAVATASAPAVKEGENAPEVTPEVAPVPVENTADSEVVEDTEGKLVEEESISIADFCKKYGISEAEFRLHNRNASDPLLQGTPVFIKKK